MTSDRWIVASRWHDADQSRLKKIVYCMYMYTTDCVQQKQLVRYLSVRMWPPCSVVLLVWVG